MRGRGSERGFTLVEIIIVLGLLSILASLGFVQYGIYVIRGKNTSACSDLKNFNSAMTAHHSEHNEYP